MIDNALTKLFTRRKIAGGLIIVWLIALVYAFAFVNAPMISITRTEDRKFPHLYVPIMDASVPPVQVTLSTTFTAKGSFSAGNPIQVSVRVEANISDFLHYYCCVAYFSSDFSPSKYNLVGDEIQGYLELHEVDVRTYDGKETLIWHLEANTYSFLLLADGLLILPVGVNDSIASKLHISSFSDTLAWQYSESSLRIEWVLIAFSVVMLQPILEAILLRDPQK